ncbi:TetR/AcrR family transcriptional regulator [Alkaliphilus peptidifermentans]|uniref:Transcriptional regulator, TetR family n=1 Tax=Alkaliphilus peptidifermentans DSM 18978 TaxID=1120976 RepID=A0A1G5IBF2_9FIRM|nr:TetR/AcrR family transcriptional regulator [Alkaliphilus peptidifermentans]SCY72990.1 transcriptional regulator, TetR family [Alkaliphilus peptidifermentans DSM 18978]
MSKGFTQKETEIIKNQLIIKGKELFIKYGYKKFGIRDLTEEIGISSGMFYKFFNSKEELFLIILENERNEIRNKIYNKMIANIDEPKNALRGFYYTIIEELQANPIMKTILVKDEYSFITKQMTEEELIKEREKSLNPIIELIQHWKEKGLIKDTDINIVIESLRSLVYLWFHKGEIGEGRYPIIIEFLIDRICDYTEI